MRHILMSLSLFAAVAAVLTGCADPTEGISEAQVNAPEQAAETSVKTYTLSDESVIGFEGYKVTGSHIGGFGAFTGSVVVPPDGIEAAHISVAIDMTSTYSDDPGLTTKLVGPDFFDVEQFPESRFESTNIEKTDDGYRVSGNLTLHGVTQNISFPAQITIDRQGLVAEAEFTINRMDFDIEYPGVAGDLIREKVVIRLDVEGKTNS